jgi:hypothetical protein
MACEIMQIEDSMVTARISGILRLVDHKVLQSVAGHVVAKVGEVRLLAFLEDFKGWEKGVDWTDVDFVVEHGNKVSKMAFVGDMKWKEDVFAFVGKGLRQSEIEFFSRDRITEAEVWVRA